MIAKVLLKIYHAVKPKQTKYSAAQSLVHRQNSTTTDPHFSLTKYTSVFVHFPGHGIYQFELSLP